MAFILLSLILFLVHQSGVQAQSYVIRKCCPLSQQIDITLQNCVDLKKQPSQYSKDLESKPNTSILENPSNPWWIPEDTMVLSSVTLEPISDFFSSQMFLKGIAAGDWKPCGLSSTKIIDEGFDLLDNGSLVLDVEDTSGEKTRNLVYPPSSFCSDSVYLGDGDGDISDENSSPFIMLCPCEDSLCVRKCCSPEKILSFSGNQTKCIEHHQNNSEEWKPDFGEGSPNLTYVTVIGSNICKPDQGIYVLNPNLEEHHKEFYILENGQVRIKENAMLMIGKYEYCIDVSQYPDGSLTSNLLSCTDRQITLRTFYSTLTLVGAFFLALTLLILILTRMRGCHAMNIMSHTASLLVAYLALAVGHLDTNISLAGCLANGFVIQFSFLAAFFWLNVMCIDISWTFSGILPPQGTVVERDRKKCIFYSLYAWGSTSFILVISLIMEFTPGIPDTFLKPGFGKQTCWFEKRASTLLYFYGPMAVLLLMNLCSFIYTATRIVSIRRDTAILGKSDSRRYKGTKTSTSRDKQRLWLYMKLFSLMGITWLTEIISWAVGGPSYYWYVTDIVNILRAVFVFIIFCCKRTTLNILCVRLHGLMPCCTTTQVMTYGKENSSSQRTGSMQLTVFNNARKTSTPKTEIQNSFQHSS